MRIGKVGALRRAGPRRSLVGLIVSHSFVSMLPASVSRVIDCVSMVIDGVSMVTDCDISNKGVPARARVPGLCSDGLSRAQITPN